MGRIRADSVFYRYNLVFIHAMARALMYTAEREAMLDVAQRAKDIEMDMLGTCLGEDHERYKQVEEQLSWVEGHMSGLYEGLEELPYFAVD